MALTLERHAVLDAELQYIHQYFTSLASEINAAAPLTDKRGSTYHAAVNIAVQVAHLRNLLAGSEEIHYKSSNIRPSITKAGFRQQR